MKKTNILGISQVQTQIGLFLLLFLNRVAGARALSFFVENPDNYLELVRISSDISTTSMILIFAAMNFYDARNLRCYGMNVILCIGVLSLLYVLTYFLFVMIGSTDDTTFKWIYFILSFLTAGMGITISLTALANAEINASVGSTR